MKIDNIHFKRNPHVVVIGKDKETKGTLYGRALKPQDVAQVSDEDFKTLVKTRRKWPITGEPVYARPITPKGWDERDSKMMFDSMVIYYNKNGTCYTATTRGI
jgi:hypothetical protein